MRLANHQNEKQHLAGRCGARKQQWINKRERRRAAGEWKSRKSPGTPKVSVPGVSVPRQRRICNHGHLCARLWPWDLQRCRKPRRFCISPYDLHIRYFHPSNFIPQNDKNNPMHGSPEIFLHINCQPDVRAKQFSSCLLKDRMDFSIVENWQSSVRIRIRMSHADLRAKPTTWHVEYQAG